MSTVGYDSSGNPGDYTSLALWWSGLGGSVSGPVLAELMNGTPAGRGPGSMTPFTITSTFPPSVVAGTSSTNTITIRPKAGYGIADNVASAAGPLRVDTTRGAALTTSTPYVRLLDNVAPYTTFRGLQLQVLAAQSKVAASGLSGTVANCVWDANVIYARTAATTLACGDNSTLTNNLILVDSGGTGPAVQVTSGSFLNNTLVRSANNAVPAGSVGIDGLSALGVFKNNAIFGFATPFSASTSPSSDYNATDQASLGGIAGTHGLVSQAYANCFVDVGTTVATADLRLKAGSPLIDAGTNLASSGVTTSILGTARPQGIAYDVGAYEYARAAVGTFTITPTAIPANHPGNIVLTLVGRGTSWGGTTVLTPSGVANVAKVSQSILSATSATVTITTGAGTGTLAITESVTGAATASTSVATAGFTISPTTAQAGTGGAIAVVGTNTVWSQDGPAGLFTVSGGAGPAISSIVVTDDAHATFTLGCGSAAASLTIAAVATGTARTFAVTPPPLVAGVAALASAGPSVINVMAADATGGTMPYAYQWERNTNGGAYAAVGDGGGVSGATTLAIADTSPSGANLYGYRLAYTDAAAVVARSNAVTAQRYTGGAVGGPAGIIRVGMNGGISH